MLHLVVSVRLKLVPSDVYGGVLYKAEVRSTMGELVKAS